MEWNGVEWNGMYVINVMYVTNVMYLMYGMVWYGNGIVCMYVCMHVCMYECNVM